LALNLNAKDYFEMVGNTATAERTQDTEMLNRALYHKIANEISILKSIVQRILRFSAEKDEVLDDIIASIEDILREIEVRRTVQKAEIDIIPADDYERIIAIISQTAHTISDFVNNELAIIESKIRRVIKKHAPDSPRQQQFARLLEQLELTQNALNDLKSINEGITIKNSRFKVSKLFAKWQQNPQINHATISLAIQNADSVFIGDEEKIKSALNELVENSLRHNPDHPDLQISMYAQDVVNPYGIRGRNVPGEQKYLFIEYRDNGKGVALDKKDWIFLPLKTTADDGKGSGLGLFIIRRTLRKMNGYIRETGVDGVRFEIHIPYAKAGGAQ
jgi:signal transduction histidine kinase